MAERRPIQDDADVILLNLGYWDLLHIHEFPEFMREFSHLLLSIRKTIEQKLNNNQRVPVILLFNMGVLEHQSTFTAEKHLYMRDVHAQKTNHIMQMLIEHYHLQEWISLVDFHSWMQVQGNTLPQSSPHLSSNGLTLDGIHPLNSIVARISDLVLTQISEQTTLLNQHLLDEPQLQLDRNLNSHLNADANSNTNAKGANSVGFDPVLGLLVGLYLFAALLTGDSFLVLNLFSCFQSS